MASSRRISSPNRLLVVAPSWVGDAAMATPTLRAIRELYPEAQITALMKPLVRPVLDACPWIDRRMSTRSRQRGPRDTFELARRLASREFDMAVLLPNSFRWALVCRMAGIPRRIGYNRDGRGGLLTERLVPMRAAGGGFLPVPALNYYLGLAKYLGATQPDPTMQLFTRPTHDQQARAMLTAAGYDPDSGKPLVVLIPGANFGDAKMWHPERFAAVADRLAAEHDAAVAVSGSPKEKPILDQVIAQAKTPIIDLPKMGLNLALLKSVMRLANLVVANDTGPRHIAAAFGVPVVTVFGPTDPAWTQIGFALERQVRVDVFCGPCQLKKCPLDHRCMTQISPEMVLESASELIQVTRSAADKP